MTAAAELPEARAAAAGAAAPEAPPDARMGTNSPFDLPQWAGGKRGGAAVEDPAAKQHKGASKGTAQGARFRDDGWRAMALCTAKLTLAVAREQAHLAAAVYETWELRTDAPLADAGIQAGQEYNARAKELHEQHEVDASVDLAQLGPPHLVVVAKTFQVLGTKVSQEDTPTLANFFAQVVRHENPAVLGECVPHYQVKKNKQKSAKGPEKCRIIFSMATYDQHARAIRDMLVKEIVKEGGQKKLGAAPRGALERELTRAVNKEGH